MGFGLSLSAQAPGFPTELFWFGAVLASTQAVVREPAVGAKFAVALEARWVPELAMGPLGFPESARAIDAQSSTRVRLRLGRPAFASRRDFARFRNACKPNFDLEG